MPVFPLTTKQTRNKHPLHTYSVSITIRGTPEDRNTANWYPLEGANNLPWGEIQNYTSMKQSALKERKCPPKFNQIKYFMEENRLVEDLYNQRQFLPAGALEWGKAWKWESARENWRTERRERGDQRLFWVVVRIKVRGQRRS